VGSCKHSKFETNYSQGHRGFPETPNNFLKIRVPWRPEPSCLGPPCQNVLRVSMFSTSLPNLVALTRPGGREKWGAPKIFDPKYFRSPSKNFRTTSNFKYGRAVLRDGTIRTKFNSVFPRIRTRIPFRNSRQCAFLHVPPVREFPLTLGKVRLRNRRLSRKFRS
jgi:hypothetical protein